MLLVRAKHAKVFHRVVDETHDDYGRMLDHVRTVCGKSIATASIAVRNYATYIGSMAAADWCKRCHPLAMGMIAPALWQNLDAAFWYGRWQPHVRRGSGYRHWTLGTFCASATIKAYDSEDDENRSTPISGTGPWLSTIRIGWHMGSLGDAEERRGETLVEIKAWALSRLRYHLEASLDVLGHAEVRLDAQMDGLQVADGSLVRQHENRSQEA